MSCAHIHMRISDRPKQGFSSHTQTFECLKASQDLTFTLYSTVCSTKSYIFQAFKIGL